MFKLLKKEYNLSLHPATLFMMLLSVMVFIPNYPYTVIFFYINLAIFFICLSGRENNDIKFTMLLPVSKKDIVKARILFAVCIQVIQLLLLCFLISVKRCFFPAENLAGMNANLTLVAEGFIIYGVFNLIFFCSYYRDVQKVGVAFIKGSFSTFILVFADVITANAISFFKLYLDNYNLSFVKFRILALVFGILIYVVLTCFACRISIWRFEKLDI